MINRAQFLKMNIEQRATLLNALLRSGQSLSSIAEMFEMARSSLSAPLLRAGFVFDKSSKQYVFDDDTMTNPLTATEILTKLDRLESLLKQYLVEEKNIPYKSTNELISKIPTGKEIRVTIRINKDIWNKFGQFCKKNENMYKKDLMSIALLELIKNYKEE